MMHIAKPTLIELLRLLMRNTGTAVISCSILSVLLFIALRNDQNEVALGVWAMATILIKVVRGIHARYYLKRQFGPDDIPALLTHLFILIFIDAAAWGALIWIALDTATVAGAVMIFAAQSAIACGAMSSLSPVWPIFAVFGITEMAVVALKLFFMHDPTYVMLAFTTIVLYCPTLIAQARNGHLAALSAIELRYKNLALIEQLRTETGTANQAKEAARAANMAKSQFLAAASHDLRQPVHAQKLFLETLSGSALTPSQRKSLDKALIASDTIGDMLNNLLDASRIEAGTITPHVTSFRLQTLLQKLEAELSPLADEKNLVYRSRDSHHVIKSDPVLLEQILRNLISNAIYYTQQGGVLIGLRKRHQHLRIEVWDTGIGIDPALHDKIFNEFYQADNPERDRHKGFGLGLAIARGLAQTLGHTISLQSVPGKGSCFSISVPLAQNIILDAPVAEAPHPAPLAPLPLTVLIIDDDDEVREAMQTLFTTWGCTCLVTDGIAGALQITQQQTPDIILSDYRLRQSTTGADAIHQVRHQLQATIPALLITGDTSPQRLQEALATGIPLLHKPVSAARLYSTVASLAQTHDTTTP